MPETVEHWSLTALPNKLIKIGAKVARYERYIKESYNAASNDTNGYGRCGSGADENPTT